MLQVPPPPAKLGHVVLSNGVINTSAPSDLPDALCKNLQTLRDLSAAGDLVAVQSLFQAISPFQANDVPQQHFQQCLLAAQQNQHPDVVRFLLSQGLLIKPMLVCIAVQQGRYDDLALFLELRYDLNEQLGVERPSVLTAAFDDQRMTEWLLCSGADPNIRHQFDITPLSVAIKTAPLPIIELLFRYGGSTAHGQLLHCAALRSTRSDRQEILSYIIGMYAEPPVDRIMYQDDLESYRWYLPFGIGTPLHYLASYGDLEAVTLLIERGANPYTRDPRGSTSIDRAEQGGHEEVAKFLRSCEAHQTNTFGETHGLANWGQL